MNWVEEGTRRGYIGDMAKLISKKEVARLMDEHKLKLKEARYVQAFIVYGSQKAAADHIGISNQLASYYHNKRNVHAALQDALEWYLPELAAEGIAIIRDLANNAEEESTRLSAAKELAKHGMDPLKQPKTQKHVFEVEQTTQDLIRDIRDLQQELGIDGKVIDAEFEETEPGEASERGSSRLKKLPFNIA